VLSSRLRMRHVDLVEEELGGVAVEEGVEGIGMDVGGERLSGWLVVMLSSCIFGNERVAI